MTEEEAKERLKLCSNNECSICGRYEKEECMLERNRCEKTVLNLLESQNKLIHKMIDYIFDEDTSNFICKEMEKECDNNCSECYLRYFKEGLNNE